MSNIFATGPTAKGVHFIGRQELTERVCQYIYKDKKNVSLVGLPKIGKSSIANRVLEKIESDIQKNNDVQTWFLYTDLAAHESFEALWFSVITRIQAQAKNRGFQDHVLDRESAYFAEYAQQNYTYVKLHAELYLKRLSSKHGIFILLFIDEFDVAIDLFSDKRFYYEFFRDIATDMNLRLMLISRQLIKQIETNAYGNSTLFGIFDEITIKGFNNQDMGEYYNVLAYNRCDLIPEERHELRQVAGDNPYLLSIFGDRIIDSVEATGGFDIEKILYSERLNILGYYDSLVKQMDHDKKLHLVLQTIVGPKYNLEKNDVDALESMGYITPDINIDGDSNGEWIVVSNDFKFYLHNKKLAVPIWDVLTKTQYELQELIKKRFLTLLGLSVNIDIPNFNLALKSNGIIDLPLYDNFVDANYRHFGVRSSLIDVVPIKILAKIIRRYWDNDPHGFRYDFRNLDYSYWEEKFCHLDKVRNPPAHARPEYLTLDDIEKANLYCEEIIKLLASA